MKKNKKNKKLKHSTKIALIGLTIIIALSILISLYYLLKNNQHTDSVARTNNYKNIK